ILNWAFASVPPKTILSFINNVSFFRFDIHKIEFFIESFVFFLKILQKKAFFAIILPLLGASPRWEKADDHLLAARRRKAG
ncbi:MAG: hypothetical protein J5700_01460, partial [Treponema sp.]|nr:hypothetical protein [Treponema sp.]